MYYGLVRYLIDYDPFSLITETKCEVVFCGDIRRTNENIKKILGYYYQIFLNKKSKTIEYYVIFESEKKIITIKDFNRFKTSYKCLDMILTCDGLEISGNNIIKRKTVDTIDMAISLKDLFDNINAYKSMKKNELVFFIKKNYYPVRTNKSKREILKQLIKNRKNSFFSGHMSILAPYMSYRKNKKSKQKQKDYLYF